MVILFIKVILFINEDELEGGKIWITNIQLII
jgi:hypothetical protein